MVDVDYLASSSVRAGVSCILRKAGNGWMTASVVELLGQRLRNNITSVFVLPLCFYLRIIKLKFILMFSDL